MKVIKLIIKAILMVGVILGLILATAENDNQTIQFVWNVGWIAEMAICAKLLLVLWPEDFAEEGDE